MPSTADRRRIADRRCDAAAPAPSICHCRSARPARSVAGQRGEAQVRHGGALAVIGKRDVLEFDEAAQPAGIDRIGPVAHRGHGIEHAEELGELWRIHEQAVGEADHLFEPRDQERRDAMKLTIWPTDARPISLR